MIGVAALGLSVSAHAELPPSGPVLMPLTAANRGQIDPQPHWMTLDSGRMGLGHVRQEGPAATNSFALPARDAANADNPATPPGFMKINRNGLVPITRPLSMPSTNAISATLAATPMSSKAPLPNLGPNTNSPLLQLFGASTENSSNFYKALGGAPMGKNNFR